MYRFIIVTFCLGLAISLIGGCNSELDNPSVMIDYQELESTGIYADNPDSNRKRIEVLGTKSDLISTLGLYEQYFSIDDINAIDFKCTSSCSGVFWFIATRNQVRGDRRL